MIEIHLTTKALTDAEIDQFVGFTHRYKFKPIIIELAEGQVQQQPMISHVVHTLDAGAFFKELDRVKQSFLANGYPIQRVKVEVPLKYAYLAEDLYPNYKGRYGEWHAKVRFRRIEDLMALKVSNAYFHISQNSLKGNPTTRFVTFRHYSTLEQFENYVRPIRNSIQNKGLTILKEEFEYCIFDSNKSIDYGWLKTPEITDGDYLNLLTFEGFLRRASEHDSNFILKGSLVTRQFFQDKKIRKIGDLDFIYTKKTDENPEDIFSDWVQQVTTTEVDDQLQFEEFNRNRFWRFIDYAMHDDFPTTNTDLICWHGKELNQTVNLDISWNLPIEKEIIEIDYVPEIGNPFKVRVPSLEIQVSWKLHQTVVRPRAKDIMDLIFLFRDNEFGEINRTKILQLFKDECIKDGIRPDRINSFADGSVLNALKNNHKILNKWFRGLQPTRFFNKFDFDSGFGWTYIHTAFEKSEYRSILAVLEDFQTTLVENDLMI